MVRIKRFAALLVAAVTVALFFAPNSFINASATPVSVVLTESVNNVSKELAEGVRYTKLTASADTKFGGTSGIEFNIVEIDMSVDNLYLDTVYGGERSVHAYKDGTTIVSNFNNQNTDITPIAAVNADLWWMYTGSAVEPANNNQKLLSDTNGHAFSLGFTMSNGEIYTTDKMPQESFITPSESTVDLPYTDFMAFGITSDNVPVISNPDALVTIKNTTKGTTTAADGINRLPAYNALVMYTDKGPRNNYSNADALEIVIDITSTPDYVIKHGTSISGKVIGIYDKDDPQNPTMDLNSNQIILTARGEKTALLSKYALNDVVKIDISVYDQWGKYTNEWQKVTDAVSGHIPFAVDGVYHSSIGLEADYPATVIGITNSGNVIMLTLGTTTTGRKGISVDLYDDLAKELDLRDAFLLDGGGSSTMVLNENGEYVVVNTPSDSNGEPRQVLNMLVLSTGPSKSAQGAITFSEKCDSNAETIDFTKPSNMFYVNGNASSCTKCSYENGALKLMAVSSYDPYITFNYMNANPNINADKYKYIIIEYMLPKMNSNIARQGEVFFQCGGINYADVKYSKMTDKYTRSGDYEQLVIDCSNQSGWAGTLNGFRLDYFNNCKSGDVMYIKSITLSETNPVPEEIPTPTQSATQKPTATLNQTATSAVTATSSATSTTKPTVESSHGTFNPVETDEPVPTVSPTDKVEGSTYPIETETPGEDVFPDNQKSFPVGAVIGIIAGSVAVLGAIVAIIIILLKKKGKIK